MKLRILTTTLLIMLLSTFNTQSNAAPCWHRWGGWGYCGWHHCAPVRYYSCHHSCGHYSACHPSHCGYWHGGSSWSCCDKDKDKDHDKGVESKEKHEGCCEHSHCGHHFVAHRCWGDYYYRGGGY